MFAIITDPCFLNVPLHTSEVCSNLIYLYVGYRYMSNFYNINKTEPDFSFRY